MITFGKVPTRLRSPKSLTRGRECVMCPVPTRPREEKLTHARHPLLPVHLLAVDARVIQCPRGEWVSRLRHGKRETQSRPRSSPAPFCPALTSTRSEILTQLFASVRSCEKSRVQLASHHSLIELTSSWGWGHGLPPHEQRLFHPQIRFDGFG